MVLRARWVMVQDPGLCAEAAVSVENGRIGAVAVGAAAVARLARSLDAQVQDLGDGVLCPGLVNAHAHLELTPLAGRVPAGDHFGQWIGALLKERSQLDPREIRSGVEAGARRLLETGTTCVGEITTLGQSASWAEQAALVVRLFHEVLDAGDLQRTEPALTNLRTALASSSCPSGVSPHAPFTVSPVLFNELGRLCGLDQSVAIHWAETPEEGQFLLEGEGPLVGQLGPSPGCSGLDLIDRAGLLRPATALVHGNCPAKGEVLRIATAGASVVHCPGTHRFFDRPKFPLQEYRAAGVTLGLGTDSAASNDDLDMRSEMKALRCEHPDVPPKETWQMATMGSAKALGLAHQVGSIAPGFRADLVLFETHAASPDQIMEELTLGMPPVDAVFLAGVKQTLRSGASFPAER